MFNLVDNKKIKLLNIEAKVYEHSDFECKHLHLASDNEEKVFMVAFKTVPSDSSGIAHILEHTALCGSKKYPVRDPFFMMLRRSLNTFMNAFTSSDWTAYPFATQNNKDFHNLLNIYTDAAFFPNLNKLDFLQEGHRFEVNQDGELEIKGVVFNEMKGAMSSVSSQLWHGMTKYLYPDTTYQFNSGGDPKEIINLTHKDLVDFHRSHYHPSNATFFSFGDLDVKEIQDFLDQNVMSQFKPLEERFVVPLAKKFQKPQYQSENYQPIDEGPKNHHVVISWLLGKSFDAYNLLEKYLLSSILIGNSAAPLRKALETSELGTATSPIMGLEPSNKELLFVVGLEGVNSNKAEMIESLVLETLTKCIKNGIDQSLIDASLHQLEINQREISSGSMPFGLQLILGSMGGCIHDENPIELLDIDSNLKKLKKNISKKGFINKLIKSSLIDNKHRLTFELKPDIKFNKNEEDFFKQFIKKKEADLDHHEVKSLKQLAEQLKVRQETADDANTLPGLDKSDIPKKRKFASPEYEDTYNAFYKCGTNGITYLDYMYNLNKLTPDELKACTVYGYILTKVGLGQKSYEDIQRYQTSISGGLQSSIKINFDNKDNGALNLVLSSKGLDKNTTKIEDLIIETITKVRFDETQRIQELLQVLISRTEESIAAEGHSLAMDYASGGINNRAALIGSIFGLNQLKFLKEIVDNYGLEKGTKKIIDLLESIRLKLCSSPHKILRISSDIKLSKDKSSSIEATDDVIDLQNKIEPYQEEIAWLIPAQVCYCSEAFSGAKFEDEDAPKLSLLAASLRNGYLHSAIREKGGAYGAGAIHDAKVGVFKFFSYRDPNCASTFDEFKESIKWTKNGLSQSHLDEAVLNVISSIDKPLSPSGEAKSDFYQNLRKIDHKKRTEFRNKILSCNVTDLKEVAEKYLSSASFKSVICGDNFNQEIEGLGLSPKKV